MHRFLIVLLLYASLYTPSVHAQGPIQIDSHEVVLEFPERLTFSAHIESDSPIERVILEYGVDELTCGKVLAKGFPQFEPGRSIDVSWTWEMLQSGSQPPGARIWYRWRVIDATGDESVSDEQRVIWLDDQHQWQSVSRGDLTLYWYDRPRSFASELINSAVDSLTRLEEESGLAPEDLIDMYIYSSAEDLRDAVLFEPGWTGGLAYPEHNILIIGIGDDQLDWGKTTEAHELTHVLVGHLTFSCLSSVPTWLNEGIAVYNEGEFDQGSTTTLQRGIDDGTLFSVRALGGSFSEHPDRASLAYAQSYSLVNYLINTYNTNDLLQLFHNLRDGIPIDEALRQAYGFGVDELDDLWRASVNAAPRNEQAVEPITTLIPTAVPTLRPIDPLTIAQAIEVAPTTVPAPSNPSETNSPNVQTSPETSGATIIAFLAVALFMLVAIMRKRKTS